MHNWQEIFICFVEKFRWEITTTKKDKTELRMMMNKIHKCLLLFCFAVLPLFFFVFLHIYSISKVEKIRYIRYIRIKRLKLNKEKKVFFFFLFFRFSTTKSLSKLNYFPDDDNDDNEDQFSEEIEETVWDIRVWARISFSFFFVE